jgi:hypothetical protein
MMALEESFQTTIEETAFTPATTVAELEALVAPPEWSPAGVRPGSDQGQTGVRPGSDQGQTRVRPGSDQGQTRVRPGSDQGQTRVRPGSDQGQAGE